ncbi:hypothetical protein SAY86_023309 [Trapa natans]|uniref:Protein kinase domain-containing protein n=1 Tax=Trapa natans TaxID=22666 RepID=A0AAN7R5P1_TRANT|nr:hypothetical protein SAY86_023309 [Trapa natans]
MAIIVSLYGACIGLVPLAAFGWVTATHMSLYPAVLIVPVILMLGYGPDAPPSKVFLQKKHKKSNAQVIFSWKRPVHFLFWSIMWGMHVLVLCGISLRQYGGLWEVLRRTYGFILTVEDLSPNIGVLWYFFAEVFDFFRSFFLIVFHMNIFFMVLPLAIRLKHLPAFLAFVYVAIVAIFKSYPSVGDSALYLGLLALFANELADMKFSFFLFCGYIGVSLLSPVMHNLWIWRVHLTFAYIPPIDSNGLCLLSVLGKGTFGISYKAILEDATTVVVKRLREVGVGNRGEGRVPLDWDTRMRIAIGAARGIARIHLGNNGKLVHRNIKSSNILNSQNYGCMSDLGLAPVMSALALPISRAAGYRAPEVTDTRKAGQPSDVFSFGVVLLELLTGKSHVYSVNGDEMVHLVRWAHSVVREEWTAEVFDMELMRYPSIEEELVEMLQIAMSCVVREPGQRPKMSDVMKMIENVRLDESDSRPSSGNKLPGVKSELSFG